MSLTLVGDGQGHTTITGLSTTPVLASAEGLININMRAPVSRGNEAPLMALGNGVHNTNNSTTFTGSMTDVNGDPINLVGSATPGTGHVTITPTSGTAPFNFTVVFLPDPAYVASLVESENVIVTVRADDGRGGSSIATTFATVQPPVVTPPNQPPTTPPTIPPTTPPGGGIGPGSGPPRENPPRDDDPTRERTV